MKQILSFLALTFLLTGCIEHKQFLRINRDGSAEIEINHSIPEKYETIIANFEGAIRQLEGDDKVSRRIDPTPRLFDQRKAYAYFEKFEGVSVHTHSSYLQDGKRDTILKLQIKDFRKALDKGLFPGWTLKEDNEKKTYTLEINNSFKKLDPKKLDEETKTMLKGLNLAFTVRTPRLISDSNSKDKTGNTAKWKFDDSNFHEAPQKFTLTFSSKGLSFFDEETKESE